MKKMIILAAMMTAWQTMAQAECTADKSHYQEVKANTCYFDGKAYTLGAVRMSGDYGMICKKNEKSGSLEWVKHDTSFFFGDR